jgi:polysaccharide export outer membrane protein
VAACAAQPGQTAADAAAAAETSPYIIGPGDKLSISVYDNPQLSVTLPVRPDGKISMPLVADVVAAGQTPTALARTLEQRLAKYEKDANVTVMVLDFLGPFDRQIRVIGEAADPQAIAYREHMSVLDVLIQTKGLTRFAAGNRSVIVRKVPNGPPIRINVKLSDLLNDGDLSQNVEMQPGDTLIIPETWF